MEECSSITSFLTPLIISSLEENGSYFRLVTLKAPLLAMKYDFCITTTYLTIFKR